MAKTNSNQTSTTTGNTTSGGINIGSDLQAGILGQIFDNFANQGGASGGVAEITPEMQAAINAMMNQQGGGNFLGSGQGMLGQAGGILGGSTSVTGQGVTDLAGQLVNTDLLKNQMGQLTEEAQKGLQSGLGAISTGASMSGGLGSSRTALAQGEAIEGSQKALANAQANLVNQTYQNAINQAIGIQQGNVSNQLTQGQLLGQLGLGQAGLGSQMNNDQINAMLKAGVITQEQADKLFNSGSNNLNTLLGQLGALMGQQGTTDQTTTTTGQSSSGLDKNQMVGGILGSVAGSIGDWLLK